MDIRTHLQQQERELIEAIAKLDAQYAWAKALDYNALACAYLVAQAELLRRVADVNKSIDILGDEQ